MESLHTGEPWKLSPSDLTFLYEECARCFWSKCARGFSRPRAPFPKIFTLLDRHTKNHFADKRTEEVSPSLPPGRVVTGDRAVRSLLLEVPGHARPVQLRGRIDASLAFDDGTHGIVDFKISTPKPEHVGFYGRQLHSYALATEHPAKGSLSFPRVSVIGLLCVEPIGMISHDEGVAYYAEPQFTEIPRSDGAFLSFLSQALFILERDEPPEASPNCQFCRYIGAGAVSLLTNIYGHELE